MCTTLSQLFPGKLCVLFFKKGQAGVALILRYVSRYFFVLRMCLRTVNFSTHLNLTLNLPRFLLQLPTHTASSSQGWISAHRELLPSCHRTKCSLSLSSGLVIHIWESTTPGYLGLKAGQSRWQGPLFHHETCSWPSKFWSWSWQASSSVLTFIMFPGGPLMKCGSCPYCVCRPLPSHSTDNTGWSVAEDASLEWLFFQMSCCNRWGCS